MRERLKGYFVLHFFIFAIWICTSVCVYACVPYACACMCVCEHDKEREVL